MPLLPPSGFSIHQELLPVPSFCMRMKRLCSDRLCLMEFWTGYIEKGCMKGLCVYHRCFIFILIILIIIIDRFSTELFEVLKDTLQKEIHTDSTLKHRHSYTRQINNSRTIDNTLRERERVEDGREDLADVVGDPEEKGFKLTLERKECIGVSDGQREGPNSLERRTSKGPIMVQSSMQAMQGPRRHFDAVGNLFWFCVGF